LNVTHLRHVALVAPEFERSIAFFSEAWGLECVARETGRAFFRTARAEPYQLELLAGEQRAIDHIALGLPARADVDDAARALTAAGVELVTPPRALAGPGGGYGLRLRDPDGRSIELSAEVALPAAQAAFTTPAFLSHVVLNTPQLDRMTEFFTGVLGFRVSDWSEHVMSFLRCNREHHSVAFNDAPQASYNHTSWELASIDELFRAQGRVRAHGTPLGWGTGRHAPGKQVFNYFVEPSGYVVEYIADGETIDDEAAWQPHVHGRTPETMDLWNTAGPPSPEIRAAMQG
jgi:catechol 2,3-dioxygenase-like lactoylglutathione lyase family enzyme